jgi:flagellar protein FlaF
VYAQQTVVDGYSEPSSFARSDRETEYHVIFRITRNLRKSTTSQSSLLGKDAIKAIHDNRKLWTHLASSVSSERNRLPTELKAQIFFLAEFVLSHSRQVLRNQAPVDPLVDINLSILRGLSGQEERA